MLDDELIEIVRNLRMLGADDADVEAKRAERRLPSLIRATLSAFANSAGGVVILGLEEGRGFAATGVRDAARIAAELASSCSTDMEASFRPCFHRGAGLAQGSFVRVHDGDRRLSSYT